MELNRYKVNLAWFETIQISDDSFYALKYAVLKNLEKPKELIELTKNYWCDTYSLKVNLPSVESKRIDKFVVVKRSSTNNYKAVVNTGKDVIFLTCSSISELNTELLKLKL